MSPTRTATTLTLGALLLLAGATAASAGGEKCAREAKQAKEAKAAKEAHVYAVEGDVHKPLRKDGPAPAYPAMAKEDRIEGVVVARLLIEKDGAVSDAAVVESLRPDLDEHTLETLRQWTFEPATLDGEPVRVHYEVTVRYRLDGEKPADTTR